MQHRHLRRQAVVGLAQHDAARAVEHLVGDGDVAPHRQAVHELAVGARRARTSPRARTSRRAVARSSRVRCGVAVVRGASPIPWRRARARRAARRRGPWSRSPSRRTPRPRGARAAMMRGGQREAFGPQHHDFHAAHARPCARWRPARPAAARADGRPRRARTWLRPGTAQFVERLPVGQRLAGMVHRPIPG